MGNAAAKDKECNTLSDYNRGRQGPDEAYRSETSAQPVKPGMDFLTEEPAQLGAQMQQGGMPLPENADFLNSSDEAPTRVNTRIVPEMLNTRAAAPVQPVQSEKAKEDKRHEQNEQKPPYCSYSLEHCACEVRYCLPTHFD